MESKSGSSVKLSKEDFEPQYNWSKEEEQDVIELHVQGFKKDQLRIQVSNSGTLTVSGERPVSDRKLTHFHKEFKFSKDHKLHQTRAKLLSTGILQITVPRKLSPVVIQEKTQAGGEKGVIAETKMSFKEDGGWQSDGTYRYWASSSGVGRRAVMVGAALALAAAVGVGAFLIWRYMTF